MTGTAPIMHIHHHLLLRTIAGFILTMATFAAIAANTVAPTGYKGYQGDIHSSAAQVCAEFNKQGSYTSTGPPAWDDFSKQLVCSYKDEQGYKSTFTNEVQCPDNSSPVSLSKCLCWGEKVASGNTCVDPDAVKQQRGGGEGATASAPGSHNVNDRCLVGPAKSKTGEISPPDRTKCPLSFRAWQIRMELGKRKVPSLAGAIAVSEGFIQKRGKVTLITAFDPKIWSALTGFAGGRAGVLLPNEVVGPNPEGIAQPHNEKNSRFEHAEDSALRWWKDKAAEKSLDVSKGVRMGTDPKACEWCTDEYELPRKDPKNFPTWITHERLGK